MIPGLWGFLLGASTVPQKGSTTAILNFFTSIFRELICRKEAGAKGVADISIWVLAIISGYRYIHCCCPVKVIGLLKYFKNAPLTGYLSPWNCIKIRRFWFLRVLEYNEIKAIPEVRLVKLSGENVIVPSRTAWIEAEEAGLDLVLVSDEDAVPPVVRI